MMENALDLRTVVFDALGDASKADQWPRMVKMAERHLDQMLRTNDQVTNAVVTVAGNVATLPADYLEMVRVGTRAIPYSEVFTANFRTGRDNYTYAIEGDEMLVTAPDGDLAIKYYAALPTLATDLTSTNWLLDQAPGVYLYATLVQALVAKPEARAAYQGDLDRAIQGLRTISDRRRFGDSVVKIEPV